MELAAMALLRALPDDYSAFKSALMLLLDYQTVKEAMMLEQQTPRASDSTIAMKTAHTTQTSPPSQPSVCDICSRPGHTLDICYKYLDAICLADGQTIGSAGIGSL
jgi:hypothetical protein